MSTINPLVATAISSAFELKPDPLLEPANNTGGALCATISFRLLPLRRIRFVGLTLVG
jgi:hypothetical protein